MVLALAGRQSARPPSAAACHHDDGESPAQLLRGLIERTVAAAFEVEPELLWMPTRGNRRIALARQVAMYLAHVSCKMTYTEVGRAFERDRSTAAHACAQIEQRRDDPEFDSAIRLLEGIVKVLAGMWPPDI